MLFFSSVFITTQFLYEHVDPLSLTVYWFSIAFVVAFLVSIIRGYNVFSYFKFWKLGLAMGMSHAIAVLTFFSALHILEPHIVGFLVRIETAFIILMSVLLLGEKLNRYELLGIFVGFAGVGLLAFSQGSYALVGVLLIGFSTLSITFQVYILKRFLKDIPPEVIIVFRIFFTLLFIIPFVLLTQPLQPLPLSQFHLVLIGASFSAIFGWLFFFNALRHIKVSTVGMMSNLEPFFVILFAFFFFQLVPTFREWAGGMLVILGAAFVAMRNIK